MSNSAERKAKIKSFGQGYHKLVKALSDVPPDALNYKIRRNVWSINEMIIHLADNETGAYLNFRRAVAEPTETLVSFDKDLWAESLDYYSQPYFASLKLFRLLRASNYLLLKNIEEHVWLHTVNYPDRGQISLEDLVDLYQEHLHKVIAEIQHNAESWKSR